MKLKFQHTLLVYLFLQKCIFFFQQNPPFSSKALIHKHTHSFQIEQLHKISSFKLNTSKSNNKKKQTVWLSTVFLSDKDKKTIKKKFMHTNNNCQEV